MPVFCLFMGALMLFAFWIGGWLYELARGLDGQPWSLLGGVGGLTYLLAVVGLRRRS